jgi:hypothetical protein
MDSFMEAVDWTAEGPFGDAAGVPTAILYGLVLVFTHAAGAGIKHALGDALSSLLGAPKERRGLFGARLEFGQEPLAVAKVGADRVRLTFNQRVRPNRLRKILDALDEVPGASDLRLHGERERFVQAGSLGGAPVDG